MGAGATRAIAALGLAIALALTLLQREAVHGQHAVHHFARQVVGRDGGRVAPAGGAQREEDRQEMVFAGVGARGMRRLAAVVEQCGAVAARDGVFDGVSSFSVQ